MMMAFAYCGTDRNEVIFFIKCDKGLKLSSSLGFSTGRFHVGCVALRLEPGSEKSVVGTDINFFKLEHVFKCGRCMGS
jgi:hypothetical protein